MSVLTWLWRKWHGEDYAPPCRLPDYRGPGWVVHSTEAGQVDFVCDGRHLDPIEAYMLGCQLRDHALALGGIVYYASNEDVDRREALRRAERDRCASSS